jgi:hypothetical protein
MAPTLVPSATCRALAWSGTAALLIGMATTALAASPVQATGSRAAREDAVRAVPLGKLSADDKQRVSATLSKASYFRRLPVQVTECDPDLYLFLVRHPEVVVNIWEVMKIANVSLERTSDDSFRAVDGAGTLCDVRYCYSDHDTQVIYAEGSYSGPLFKKPIRAKCVLLLKSGYMQETNGRYYVTSRMDTFLDIEHAGVQALAKTLQPLVNRAADYNFVETAAFLGQISHTSEINPVGVGRLARKLTKLEPDVRQRFAELSLTVGQRAQAREASQASIDLPIAETPMQGASLERR